MKNLFFICYIFCALTLNAQNFFPIKGGDIYQYYKIEIYTYPEWYTHESFSNHIVTEFNFQNRTYVKLNDHYYRNDTTSNKLYILINNEEKLAFDFSKPSGSSDTLYFDGIGGVYTYTYGTILFGNELKSARSIWFEDVIGTQYRYTLLDGIGFYDKEYKYINGYGDYDTKYTKVIGAIIDETLHNNVTLNISPIIPTELSFENNEFDIIVDINATFIQLVDSLSAQIVLFGSDSLIFQDIYNGIVDQENIHIDLPLESLMLSDSIGVKIKCSDTSLGPNIVFYPETGFHYFPVVNEVAWSLIIPQINAPGPLSMTFFTKNKGVVFGHFSNPLVICKNVTYDGGNTFADTLSNNFGYAENKNVIRTDSTTGYRLSYPLQKTTNGGEDWIPILEVSYGKSISFINNSFGWISVGGPNPFILRTNDGGENWDSLYLSEPQFFDLLSFVNEYAGYGFTEERKFYKTIDAGESWTLVTTLQVYQTMLYMFENNSGYVIGSGIYKTTDGGANWSQQLEGGYYFDAHFFDADHGWVIGRRSGNELLYTSDGGNDWIPYSFPVTGGDFKFIDFIDPLNGWIYSDDGVYNSPNGRLLKTTNGGVTFIEENERPKTQPSIFLLEQNYPNPFNPSTTIKYSIPNAGIVTLKIYDVLGKEVATLVKEEKPAGKYEVEFNATNLTSGIYFYQLKSGNFVETKKMLLLK